MARPGTRYGCLLGSLLVTVTLGGCDAVQPIGTGPTGSPIGATTQPTQAPTGQPTPSPTPAALLPAPVRLRVPLPHTDIQAPGSEEVAVAGGLIWIVGHSRSVELLRFDPVAGRFLPPVGLPHAVVLQTSDDGTLWAVGPYGYAPGPSRYTVSRVNLETGRPKAVVDVPVGQVAIGLGSIWSEGRSRVIRIDPETGSVIAHLDFRVDRLQVACRALWGWTWGDDGETTHLARIDPETGKVRWFDGQGPLYERSDGCWRWVTNGIQHITPLPPETTDASSTKAVVFDGASFWKRGFGFMQRWDPIAGHEVGQAWSIDAQDISPWWKVGDDGLVISAGGYVWLINGWEIVGFDIAAEPRG